MRAKNKNNERRKKHTFHNSNSLFKVLKNGLNDEFLKSIYVTPSSIRLSLIILNVRIEFFSL